MEGLPRLFVGGSGVAAEIADEKMCFPIAFVIMRRVVQYYICSALVQ